MNDDIDPQPYYSPSISDYNEAPILIHIMICNVMHSSY